MMTLRQFSGRGVSLPGATGWLLADLGEMLGKQALFTRQSPQRLKVLREHALIDSAVSSNRIEGVEVEQSRVATVVFGRAALRDRDEEEVRGYREALNLIHTSGSRLEVSEATMRELHRRARGESWDAGQYKEHDADIIERHADGRVTVRFRPVAANQTPAAMEKLVRNWQACRDEKWVHPLVALAAFNLDFLCIHPFRDGNGRCSRLLLLLHSYHAGMEVGRYISLERIIEQNKERYYETLQQSSQGWHEGRHDPWSYINFILFVLKTAYREFEARVGETADDRGAKEALVREAVARQDGPFRLVEVERACPGVGRDWLRAILQKMRDEGDLRTSGRGPAARWERVLK